MRAVLWASSALAVFLSFAWPFAISADAASPVYRMLAVASLVGILVPIAALVLRKALQGARSS